MASPSKPPELSEETRATLRCPACRSALQAEVDRYRCAACAANFPIVAGVPILIDEARSILRIADYQSGAERVLAAPPARRSALRRIAGAAYRMLPDVDRNVASSANYARFAALLLETRARPRVLVVGGREVGKGLTELLTSEQLEFVETDIDFGPRTKIVCDAHQLPFDAASMDGVIVQAVLEHVLDPYTCVAEIHRVLKPDGLVYAETPFLYRRHGGPFDFTRFTFLGHRRLFRRFSEVSSGAAVGPAVALALSYTGLLLTLSGNRPVRAALRVFGRLTSFWLKYLDAWLVSRDAALDAAAGLFFLGRKSEATLSDRELIAGFRGMR